jgi:hypothetical protein
MLQAQECGCTDKGAKNFNEKAVVNDGSCEYKPVTLQPNKSFVLEELLHETSGLTYNKGKIWTHNDDKDSAIYGFNLVQLEQSEKVVLKHDEKINLTKVVDWEALAQDSLYWYVGDFGNNYRGNRKPLFIKKISKDSTQIAPQSIAFTYEDQLNFDKQLPNKTNFDCEAFIVKGDSLYLFTKQWEQKQTTVYSLPNVDGTHVAKKGKTFDVGGLVTDATYVEDKNILVFSGYSETLSPFIYVFYDFKGVDFFGGNKRKFKLGLNFHQVEGITTLDGLTYYLTNEKVRHLGGLIDVKPKLHVVDLSPYLKDYMRIFETDLDTFKPEIIEEEVELNTP